MSDNFSQKPSSSNSEHPNFAVIIHQETTKGPVDIVGSLPETIRMDSSSSWEAPMPNGILGMLPGSISGLLRMYGIKPATQAMTLQVWQGTEGPDMSLDLVFRTYSDPIKDIRAPLLALLKLSTPSVDSNGVITSPGPAMDPAAAGKLVVGAAAMTAGIVGSVSELVGQVGGSLAAALGNGLGVGNFSKPEGTTKDPSTQSMSPGALDDLYKSVPSLEDVKKSIRNQISIWIGDYLYFDSVVITGVTPESDLSYLDGLTSYPNVVHVTVTFRPLFMVTAADWDQILVDPSNTNLR